MSDQTNEVKAPDPAAPVKAPMDPVEIYRRNVRTMSNRQLSGHLRRKKRQKITGMDGLWACVSSIVFDNTQSSGVGGKLMPYLR
jgi:hypothetical protein